ncbi:MAG: amino acid adenylation domain-containing protein [Nocardioidaceae bacterium]
MSDRTEADLDRRRVALPVEEPTSLPSWSSDPTPGVRTLEVTVLAETHAALREVATDTGTDLASLMLAAHGKVLAALTGEQAVVTRCLVAPSRTAVPCRLTTDPGSWRDLVVAGHRASTAVRGHGGLLVDDGSRPGAVLRTTARATVVDLSPRSHTLPTDTLPTDTLPTDTALSASLIEDGGRLTLRLTYRTEVIDPAHASRIAGYHVAALAGMALEPDARHDRASLLSPEEVRHQLVGLAGPDRPLPDRRFHELFEQRVRSQPDAVAAVHGQQSLTYAELNSRANRVARALLVRGLSREETVAVVTERDLDWMTAVLGILKSGGAYLPLEPHFPPGRIATILTRADCRLVLTREGCTATLDAALASLPGVQTLDLDAARQEGLDDSDPGIPVTDDQLAYLYFTSGSTGEPKGVMCEQAGMLNHLFAKIDDLGIDAGDVLAQTAPQCFDISLWQLVAPLLVGGRTLLVEQEAVLDVERFVDTIAVGRVSVLQVVPSYLEAVLSYLERSPRELPSLRCVCVTGEALKKELALRWFAAKPDVTLVNAYGLTETSDDTNHEIMRSAPVTETVPIGRPVNNVRVYVVDEHLAPVPLGAPGLVVFSGVCVGRGYVNDPERTGQCYLSDPHRPGVRLYRSGDYGRWLPGGTLEFLGRQDSQVKISGFRIEIGEIENTLLKVAGVRDGAVVVVSGADGKHLVAFYTAPQPLDVSALRERLGESLPAYMLPAAIHWRDELPLTGNGKIDRKALMALAAELADVSAEREAPVTATETRLAAAWATALGLAAHQVGRRDHFFDRGGSSLSAVKLAVALDRAVSLKDITRHPVLADLAELMDGGPRRSPGLLHLLSERSVEPGAAPAAALVCFPGAGGTAVGYRPVAAALRGSDITVYGVDLPGHDPAGDGEPLVALDEVVRRVVAEIAALGARRVLLWGHSSGTAFAVQTARVLRRLGVEVEHLLLAGQLPGDASARRAGIVAVGERSDAAIVADLASAGDRADLSQLDAQRARVVAAAYRHDCVSAHRYFAALVVAAPDERLTAPITAVVAADDPVTAGYSEAHLDWRLVAEHVRLHVIRDGGHHFWRTRPTETARAVLDAVGTLARP